MADKLVNYDKFCPHCSNKNVPEASDPCADCLTSPARNDSHVPSKFSWDFKGTNPVTAGKTKSQMDFTVLKR